ncbi:hypothetical protein YC2023_036306 [Brassica napus]
MTGGSNLKCGDIPSSFPYHLTTSSRKVHRTKGKEIQTAMSGAATRLFGT